MSAKVGTMEEVQLPLAYYMCGAGFSPTSLAS